MKRCAVAVTFLALGLAGCGTQGVGTSASVGQREANGEPTMGAGDELGWSLYNSDLQQARTDYNDAVTARDKIQTEALKRLRALVEQEQRPLAGQ